MDMIRNNPEFALSQYTKKNAEELAVLLRIANEAYRNTSKSLLPDDIYDMAEARLRKLVPKHPFLKQVGAPVHTDNKVKLPFWMGSLDKIKDDGDKSIQSFIKAYPGSYIVSHKLDGNSGMLVYKNTSIALYSRGDGKEGQDLSSLLKYIKIPKLSGENIAVRGEIIISKRNWSAVSHKGANVRNMVAGILHAKTPDIDIAKRIDFVAYELLSPKMKYSDGLQFLELHGFNVVRHQQLSPAELTSSNLSKILLEERENVNYEIDGIVVMHDAEHKHPTGKNPKYAFAFKSILTHEEAEVVVSGIEWRVSKDGLIKPTIIFPKVNLSGAHIQRATGNNAAFIEQNGIGVGAKIVIIRSGDVIPKVIRIVSRAPDGPSMPDMPYKWNDTRVDITIISNEVSQEQKLRNLEHFAKKLSIRHVAVGTLKKFVDSGYDNIKSLFSMKENDILAIPGFQHSSANSIIASLQKVKSEASCLDMMIASNVFGRGLGDKKLKAIVDALPKVITGSVPTIEELKAIDGIGDATAHSFISGLTSFLKLMNDINMPCRGSSHSPKCSNFSGEVVVFTGFRNKELELLISSAGGQVSSSITSKVTLVVASNPSQESTKLSKARSLNIKIISIEELQKRLCL